MTQFRDLRDLRKGDVCHTAGHDTFSVWDRVLVHHDHGDVTIPNTEPGIGLWWHKDGMKIGIDKAQNIVRVTRYGETVWRAEKATTAKPTKPKRSGEGWPVWDRDGQLVELCKTRAMARACSGQQFTAGRHRVRWEEV